MPTRCHISDGQVNGVNTGCIRDAIHDVPCDVRPVPDSIRKHFELPDIPVDVPMPSVAPPRD